MVDVSQFPALAHSPKISGHAHGMLLDVPGAMCTSSECRVHPCSCLFRLQVLSSHGLHVFPVLTMHWCFCLLCCAPAFRSFLVNNGCCCHQPPRDTDVLASWSGVCVGIWWLPRQRQSVQKEQGPGAFGEGLPGFPFNLWLAFPPTYGSHGYRLRP